MRMIVLLGLKWKNLTNLAFFFGTWMPLLLPKKRMQTFAMNIYTYIQIFVMFITLYISYYLYCNLEHLISEFVQHFW